VKKWAGILVVSLVVGLLGVYGGYVGANLYGRATAAPPVHVGADPVDCSAEYEAVAKQRDDLQRELGALEAALEERYLAAGDGPRSLPPDSLPQTSIQVLAKTLFGFDVEVVHCREYPCVLVLQAAPSDEALEQLRIANFTPRVVGDGPRWAVVLEQADYPVPERTKPRVQALLE